MRWCCSTSITSKIGRYGSTSKSCCTLSPTYCLETVRTSVSAVGYCPGLRQVFNISFTAWYRSRSASSQAVTSSCVGGRLFHDSSVARLAISSRNRLLHGSSRENSASVSRSIFPPITNRPALMVGKSEHQKGAVSIYIPTVLSFFSGLSHPNVFHFGWETIVAAE